MNKVTAAAFIVEMEGLNFSLFVEISCFTCSSLKFLSDIHDLAFQPFILLIILHEAKK